MVPRRENEGKAQTAKAQQRPADRLKQHLGNPGVATVEPADEGIKAPQPVRGIGEKCAATLASGTKDERNGANLAEELQPSADAGIVDEAYQLVAASFRSHAGKKTWLGCRPLPGLRFHAEVKGCRQSNQSQETQGVGAKGVVGAEAQLPSGNVFLPLQGVVATAVSEADGDSVDGKVAVTQIAIEFGGAKGGKIKGENRSVRAGPGHPGLVAFPVEEKPAAAAPLGEGPGEVGRIKGGGKIKIGHRSLEPGIAQGSADQKGAGRFRE